MKDQEIIDEAREAIGKPLFAQKHEAEVLERYLGQKESEID